MSTPRECIGCARLSACTETSTERLLSHFVCPVFVEVSEPVYAARWMMFNTYGVAGAKAMMEDRSNLEEEER